MHGLPNYKNLDQSGESGSAARRMEARASEPASEAMVRALVIPLLSQKSSRILELGCGTGALARRLTEVAPAATVYGTDKSEGMLQFARGLAPSESHRNIRFEQWDVLDPTAFPFQGVTFDLILSSVMVPYLPDDKVPPMVRGLAEKLEPGGTMAFIEQDLHSDSLNLPSQNIFRKIFAKDKRKLKPSMGLGLRSILRAAGLSLEPRRSFLWTDDKHGEYTRDLLGKMAEDSYSVGEITLLEKAEWSRMLEALVSANDFYYGLVYHCIAARK